MGPWLAIWTSVAAHLLLLLWLTATVRQLPAGATAEPSRAEDINNLTDIELVVVVPRPSSVTAMSALDRTGLGDFPRRRQARPPEETADQGVQVSTPSLDPMDQPTSARTSSIRLGADAAAPSHDDNDDRPSSPASTHGWPLRPTAGGELTMSRRAYTATIHRDGSTTFNKKGTSAADVLKVFSSGLSFDLTETLMRPRGIDPDQREKLDFLDATRDLRAQMNRRQRSENLRVSVHNIHDRLLNLWRRRELPAATRRHYLFKLWDECAETGDPELVVRARQIRQSIMAFVRENLPVASIDGFGVEELATLNRIRSSQQRFEPY